MPLRCRTIELLGLTGAVAVLAGCGSGDPAASPPVSPPAQAAAQTATENALCRAIQPFYWEIGDASGRLASGASPTSSTLYSANAVLPIASASKWLYSTYWVQRVGGEANLSTQDLQFFNFKSGYTNFTSCSGSTTVANCLTLGTNGVQDPATIGKFDYGGGHMQKHAADHGLGPLDEVGLATEIRSQIGADISLRYTEPQLAGGAAMAPAEYGKMLRKIVAGDLLMRNALGTHAVCASPRVCPAEALSSPAPASENWSYAVGHWVEDTSNDSDGAFSSPGAFGFYPWIDKTRTWYGVLARAEIGGALTSVSCGRLIRKAWVTGVAQ